MAEKIFEDDELIRSPLKSNIGGMDSIVTFFSKPGSQERREGHIYKEFQVSISTVSSSAR